MTTSKSLKGGAKKSNGHKMNCGCPICKNMSKSKKRGGESEIEDVVVEDKVNDVDNNNELLVVDGGKRKRNHLKGTKKRGNGHKMNCGCPICKNMRKSKKRGGGEDKDEVNDEDEVNGEDEVNDEDEVNVDVEDEENVPKVQDDEEENIDKDQPITGGKKSRKRSSRRKGRKTKKRSSRRKGRKTKRRSSRRK